MDLDHPPDDMLARFVMGGTTPHENRPIVRHLLTECPKCAAVCSAYLRRTPPPGSYDSALDRFTAKARRWSAGTEKRSPCSPRQPNLLSQL
jgi:hypothetical protein